MLGKVVFVNFHQFSLDSGNHCRVFMVDPGYNAFRHPANDQIVVVGFQQAVVENFLNGLILLDAFIIGKERRVGGFQKLIKIKGV